MRGAERREGHAKAVVGGRERGSRLEGSLDEGSPLVLDAGVFVAEETEQVALDLVGDHLEDGRQVLPFGGEFDDRPAAEGLDHGDTLGEGGALLPECRDSLGGLAEGVADLAMGDLEASRRRAFGFRVVERRAAVLLGELRLLGACGLELGVEVATSRIRDGSGRIVGLDGVLSQRVDFELVAHVLEEVLLPPALEHAVGDLDCLEVEPAREDRRLVAIVTEPRHLPQAEVTLEERDALVVQVVLDRASVDPSPVYAEQLLRDLLDAPLSVGEHVETKREELA